MGRGKRGIEAAMPVVTVVPARQVGAYRVACPSATGEEVEEQGGKGDEGSAPHSISPRGKLAAIPMTGGVRAPRVGEFSESGSRWSWCCWSEGIDSLGSSW